MSGTRALMVDDEKAFVETVARRLARAGIEVVPAYDGEQALRVLETESDIDVVVLDIKMPNLDGFQTLPALRERHPDLPVIILTGHGTVESAIRGMKLGAFDYLTKPCDLGDLIRGIEAAVERGRSRP